MKFSDECKIWIGTTFGAVLLFCNTVSSEVLYENRWRNFTSYVSHSSLLVAFIGEVGIFRQLNYII
jgi:hypothetical protein